ncbi:centromere protein V [Oryza brachyantha]|uniref:centromere protein V n=1 Tax=Oryza brachyantha TaxID=4533 RepID=UPI001ADC91DC|nr:centromere protein V [Oryza brachyantha]
MSSEAPADVVHSGGCHCRRVRWTAEAPASVVAWICNCSDCSMRGNTHFVVPTARFALDPAAAGFLTTYTFGTHKAKHTFCKACGITSFYTPRANPDGVAITVACVDPGTLSHVEYRHADGRNWEKWFAGSGISGFSKPQEAAPAPPPPPAAAE